MPYGPTGASATTFTARARRRRSDSSRTCSRRCSRCSPRNSSTSAATSVPRDAGRRAPSASSRIREEGLKDEYQLQSYFIHRIERWMHAHGREIIGWDEILQGGISKTANIMSWNGCDPGIKAAQQGNPVIMAPKWYCYFDYSQTSDPERYEPLGSTRYVSVRQAYRLDPWRPAHAARPAADQGRAVQPLDGVHRGTCRHAQHMVLPRMAALAETGWANDRKDYNDFRAPDSGAGRRLQGRRLQLRPLSVRGHRIGPGSALARHPAGRRTCGVLSCAGAESAKVSATSPGGSVSGKTRPAVGRNGYFPDT